MNDKEKNMYADFIMAMRQRGRQEYDVPDEMSENNAAEHVYGQKYLAIREDFKERVQADLRAKGASPPRRNL